MNETGPAQKEVVQVVYQFAVGCIQKGMSAVETERALREKGLDAQTAKIVVRNLLDAKSEAEREAGKRNMLFGALWCVGGIIVTALTYQAAANAPGGGKYVVAWGAILFGAIQFFRGLLQGSE